MREISEGAPGAASADDGGLGRFRIGTKWQIAAASLITGLLLCGAFGITARKHGEFVRANAQAHLDREDVLASEQAVSAFWQEREVMVKPLPFRAGACPMSCAPGSTMARPAAGMHRPVSHLQPYPCKSSAEVYGQSPMS